MFTGLTRQWKQLNTKNIPSQYKQSASKTILSNENSLLKSNTHLTQVQRHTPLSYDTLNRTQVHACHRTSLHNKLNKVSQHLFFYSSVSLNLGPTIANKFYESSLISSFCDSEACQLSDLQTACGAIRVKIYGTNFFFFF
jgi:hypothetical protein